MSVERRQFRILFRDFLGRMVDLDILSVRGGIVNLLVQFAAVLAAFSFVVTISTLPKYGTSPLPRRELLVLAWSHEEFLIATSMAITGLFAVLAWNVFLPDRRDCYVLGVLPVRARTIAASKAAAIGAALAVSVAAVNSFTGLSFPFVVSADGTFWGALRSMAAYWITVAACGLFVCCALLALQGITSQVLSYRMFLRALSGMQLAAFATILGIYFLTPPLATVAGLTAPQNQTLLAMLPQFWFLGLFQELNGSTHTVFGPLAMRALWGLLIAVSAASASYGLAYGRNIRRIIEQPDIAPADRTRPATRVVKFLVTKFLAKPLDRAILLFTARTIARSRQHRLLFAVYGGIGLAIALAYAKSMINGSSGEVWYQPNRALLSGSLVLLFFAVIGARATFALPIALPANWIFRITAIHSPGAYFGAVRKSLFAIAAVPIWIGSVVVYFTIWPGRPALMHIVILVLAGIVLVHRSLRQFRKIPFACSYLPGKGNLKVALGVYGTLILLLSDIGIRVEFFTMQKLTRFAVLCAILGVAAVWSLRRTAEFARSPYNRLQFEDLPPGEILDLNLRNDSASSGSETYVDVRVRRSFRERLTKVAAIGLAFVAWGVVYEQFGRWRDHRRSPQVGTSFDIGGRSLNISCAGEGSPAVIFESNWGDPGLSWQPLQREMQKFTRVCWYDRAGYGWSDPGPFPNHSDSIARDLHRLLKQAHIPPPYVLAAHAMGAFHSRVFRGFYPADVAGLVLIDPMNEDMTIHIHNHNETFRPVVLAIRRLEGNLGFARLMRGDPGTRPRVYSQQEWETLVILKHQLKSRVAEGQEPPLWISGELARTAGRFGDIPVTVLSAGIQDQEEDPKLDHDHALKLELHRRLAGFSTRGVHVIVENSGHEMPQDAPQAIIDAVRDVAGQVRSVSTPDFRVEKVDRAAYPPPPPSSGTSVRPTR